MPFSQSAMLLREPLAGGALTDLTEGLPGAHETIAEYFGFKLMIGSMSVTNGIAVLVLIAMTIVCGGLGALRMRRSIN